MRYGGLENRPLGKEPTSWICPCCTMPWVRKGATKCMGCGKKTEPIDTATNSATLEMAGTHWQLTVDDQGNAVWTAARSQVPDLTGIPMSKAGGSGAARPGAEGPDRPPTIPPASHSGATSSGAEGPDKPSATPVGLDTKDPEVQLSVLRWMMSKRVGEVRIFAGRWVRRPGPVHVPDWAKNLTKVNLEALEKGTHPRNHQMGGLPWARYSVDELNQQAKAGDRPYLGDLRSIFWAAPHDPDEDFHWTRQISSWTLLWGCLGTATPCASSGEYDPGDERISVPVESLQQFPEVYKALMDRIGGPGALAEVKVNWRCNTKQWWVGAVPDSVAPSIYRKLGYTNDMIKLMGLGCRTGADGPDIRPRVGEGDEGIVYPPITADNVHSVVGKDRKKNYPVEMKHVFWAHMECGLVLSHPVGTHPEDKRGDSGGLHVQVL